MYYFLRLLPAAAVLYTAYAIPAEAPWAATSEADLSKTTETDISGDSGAMSDHLESDFQQQSSSSLYHMESDYQQHTSSVYSAVGNPVMAVSTTSAYSMVGIPQTTQAPSTMRTSTLSAYAAITSCTTFHQEVAPYEAVTSCTTYHNENNVKPASPTNTATSGTSQQICTTLADSFEWCYPAPIGAKPDPLAFPRCNDTACALPVTYWQQTNVPSDITIANTVGKVYTPWLGAKDWDAKVTREWNSRIVVTMFAARWMKYLGPQYDAFNETASGYWGIHLFYKVDIDGDDIAGRLKEAGLTGLPQYVFWRSGKKLGELVGAQSAKAMKAKMDGYIRTSGKDYSQIS